MTRAILFDLDETLILDETISLQAFRAAAEAVAPVAGADAARLAADAGRIARRLWQESPHFAYCHRIGHSAWEGLWARYDGGEHPAIAALREWAPGYRVRTWREALQAQGLAADAANAERAAAHFFQARRQYPLYPEVGPLLEALAGRYLLGIVTNGVPDLQREKLAGSGVAARFQATVVSGEVDCGKPDPGIFRHICAELGVAPAQCVMVGDNPERDVAGAIAAGMRSVWVRRGGRPADRRFVADLSCTDLGELLPWLTDREG